MTTTDSDVTLGPVAAPAGPPGLTDPRGDFWTKILAAGAARIYVAVVGVVTLVLTARWLGPEGRGIVAVMITWTTLGSTIGSLSLGQVGVHRAGIATDRSWLAPVIGSVLALAAGASAVLVLAGAATYVISGGAALGIPGHPFLVGLALLPLMLWEPIGAGLLMAVDRLDLYNRAQVAGRTVGLVSLVAVLAADGGATEALLAILAGQLIVSSMGMRFLVQQAPGSRRPSRSHARSLAFDGVRLHLSTVGYFLLVGAGTLVVNSLDGEGAIPRSCGRR